MKRFSEYLVETTISRIYQHATNPAIAVGIISASRKDTAATNVQRTTQLANMVRSAGYGYVFVDGRYVEDGGPVQETSIFVIGDGDSTKLQRHLETWRNQFEQESVLFRPAGEKKAYLLFRDGGKMSLGDFHPDRAGEFMTHLRGRSAHSFVFEAVNMATQRNVPVRVTVGGEIVEGTIVWIAPNDLQVSYNGRSKGTHMPYFAMRDANNRFVVENGITELGQRRAQELLRELYETPAES